MLWLLHEVITHVDHHNYPFGIVLLSDLLRECQYFGCLVELKCHENLIIFFFLSKLCFWQELATSGLNISSLMTQIESRLEMCRTW